MDHQQHDIEPSNGWACPVCNKSFGPDLKQQAKRLHLMSDQCSFVKNEYRLLKQLSEGSISDTDLDNANKLYGIFCVSGNQSKPVRRSSCAFCVNPQFRKKHTEQCHLIPTSYITSITVSRTNTTAAAATLEELDRIDSTNLESNVGDTVVDDTVADDGISICNVVQSAARELSIDASPLIQFLSDPTSGFSTSSVFDEEVSSAGNHDIGLDHAAHVVEEAAATTEPVVVDYGSEGSIHVGLFDSCTTVPTVDTDTGTDVDDIEADVGDGNNESGALDDGYFSDHDDYGDHTDPGTSDMPTVTPVVAGATTTTAAAAASATATHELSDLDCLQMGLLLESGGVSIVRDHEKLPQSTGADGSVSMSAFLRQVHKGETSILSGPVGSDGRPVPLTVDDRHLPPSDFERSFDIDSFFLFLDNGISVESDYKLELHMSRSIPGTGLERHRALIFNGDLLDLAAHPNATRALTRDVCRTPHIVLGNLNVNSVSFTLVLMLPNLYHYWSESDDYKETLDHGSCAHLITDDICTDIVDAYCQAGNQCSTATATAFSDSSHDFFLRYVKQPSIFNKSSGASSGSFGSPPTLTLNNVDGSIWMQQFMANLRSNKHGLFEDAFLLAYLPNSKTVFNNYATAADAVETVQSLMATYLPTVPTQNAFIDIAALHRASAGNTLLWRSKTIQAFEHYLKRSILNGQSRSFPVFGLTEASNMTHAVNKTSIGGSNGIRKCLIYSTVSQSLVKHGHSVLTDVPLEAALQPESLCAAIRTDRPSAPIPNAESAVSASNQIYLGIANAFSPEATQNSHGLGRCEWRIRLDTAIAMVPAMRAVVRTPQWGSFVARCASRAFTVLPSAAFFSFVRQTLLAQLNVVRLVLNDQLLGKYVSNETRSAGLLFMIMCRSLVGQSPVPVGSLKFLKSTFELQSIFYPHLDLEKDGNYMVKGAGIADQLEWRRFPFFMPGSNAVVGVQKDSARWESTIPFMILSMQSGVLMRIYYHRATNLQFLIQATKDDTLISEAIRAAAVPEWHGSVARTAVSLLLKQVVKAAILKGQFNPQSASQFVNAWKLTREDVEAALVAGVTDKKWTTKTTLSLEELIDKVFGKKPLLNATNAALVFNCLVEQQPGSPDQKRAAAIQLVVPEFKLMVGIIPNVREDGKSRTIYGENTTTWEWIDIHELVSGQEQAASVDKLSGSNDVAIRGLIRRRYQLEQQYRQEHRIRPAVVEPDFGDDVSLPLTLTLPLPLQNCENSHVKSLYEKTQGNKQIRAVWTDERVLLLKACKDSVAGKAKDAGLTALASAVFSHPAWSTSILALDDTVLREQMSRLTVEQIYNKLKQIHAKLKQQQQQQQQKQKKSKKNPQDTEKLIPGLDQSVEEVYKLTLEASSGVPSKSRTQRHGAYAIGGQYCRITFPSNPPALFIPGRSRLKLSTAPFLPPPLPSPPTLRALPTLIPKAVDTLVRSQKPSAQRPVPVPVSATQLRRPVLTPVPPPVKRQTKLSLKHHPPDQAGPEHVKRSRVSSPVLADSSPAPADAPPTSQPSDSGSLPALSPIAFSITPRQAPSTLRSAPLFAAATSATPSRRGRGRRPAVVSPVQHHKKSDQPSVVKLIQAAVKATADKATADKATADKRHSRVPSDTPSDLQVISQGRTSVPPRVLPRHHGSAVQADGIQALRNVPDLTISQLTSPISQRDALNSMIGSEWIDGVAIYAATQSLIVEHQRRDVIVFDTETVTVAMGDDHPDYAIEALDAHFRFASQSMPVTTGYMFINQGGQHWVLAIFEFEHHKITYLDPLHFRCNPLWESRLKELFKSMTGNECSNFITTPETAAIQYDGFNCGVYCYQYAVSHLSQMAGHQVALYRLPLDLGIHIYRVEMRNRVLGFFESINYVPDVNDI